MVALPNTELCSCADCSSKEQELAVTVQKPLDHTQPGRSSTPLAGSRASFASVPRGSIGPGSVAGTAVSGATAATGRPGSGAKSGMSGVSGVSGAKSKVSLASAISAGIVLAKDKLAQVSTAAC